jgi:hypothetical protein
MKATVLYKAASIMLVMAAAGNTYSFVRFWHEVGSMDPARFPWAHSHFTYAQVVLALSLLCSLCILFGAYLAWHLGGLARTTPQAIGALGWFLFAYQLIGVYVSFNVLSGPVRLLTLVLAICTGGAAWLSRSSSATLAAAK